MIGILPGTELQLAKDPNIACVTVDDGKTIEKDLPLDTAVAIDVTFPKAGKLGYACSMNMTKGTIVVQ